MDTISKIRERMPVVANDGRQVGFVSNLAGGDRLRLTQVKGGHGFEHVIPLTWVSDVDRYVFLNRASAFVVANWVSTQPHRPQRAA